VDSSNPNPARDLAPSPPSLSSPNLKFTSDIALGVGVTPNELPSVSSSRKLLRVVLTMDEKLVSWQMPLSHTARKPSRTLRVEKKTAMLYVMNRLRGLYSYIVWVIDCVTAVVFVAFCGSLVRNESVAIGTRKRQSID
jgi:hypothetical protein